jgi:tRNA A37 threonylcarbamoyladenosine dehydratase
MENWLERSALLIGDENIEKLKKAHVLIVGLGGIGSFAAEFIARSGVGKITLIDGDAFDPTNKNRQLTALDSTIGRNKAVVLAERIKDINPATELVVLEEFVQPERVWEILNQDKPQLILECIDSVSPKIEWIIAALRLKIRIISHFGAGGKLDPSRVQCTNLPNTYNCNLAAHVKKNLKKRGIDFKVVKAIYSSEAQQKSALKMTNGLNFKKSYYGTISYMPALFGLMGAAEGIRYLTQLKKPS